MKVSPFAGKRAEPSMLIDVPRLVSAFFTEVPDPSVSEQRIAFGTSGHRGSSLENAFNEWHILATTQAICHYHKGQNIEGPLFLGMDTHALSVPAFASALEVLAANGVNVMIAEGDEYTPTPAVSHAILTYNRKRKGGLADGIVITPSHNPPRYGGFKYNPPNGGPAESSVTDWIEERANEFLESGLRGVKRIPFEKALRVSTTYRHDYLGAYTSDLINVIDMGAIRGASITLGVDPLGRAGVHYWQPIAERYGLNLTVINEVIDPTFRFMPVDWDGQIRMDEVPVGFKWFVDGLLDGSLGFGGEESAGASFSRLNGSAWTTDKDGIVSALLAAEITARMDRDPGEIYRQLTDQFGEPFYDRVEAPATPEQKEILKRLTPDRVRLTALAGERIRTILTHAPGNGAPIGGLKVVAQSGWFAARPSGTENIYKIYAESFRGADHLRHVIAEAQKIVNDALASAQREETGA